MNRETSPRGQKGQARESLAVLLLLAAGLALSVVIDKTTYGHGEAVTFNVSDTPNNVTNATVYFPNGTMAWTQNYTLGASGQNNSNSMTLPTGAGAPNGTWNITVYNWTANAASFQNFNVTAYYAAPTLSLNTTTATVARMNASYFQINITNNGNVNDTFLLNHTCDANLTCVFNSSNAFNILPNTTQTVNFSANATATANFTTYSVAVSVNFSSNNTVNSAQTLSITVPDWYGANLTANATHYVKRGVWETNTFVVQLNNSGSMTDNLYLNITAGNWNVSVDGDNVTAGLSREKYYNNLAGNSNQSILINVTVPSTAQMNDYAYLTLFVKSLNNTAKNQTLVLTLKRPEFNISAALTLSNETSNLTINVSNAAREGAPSVSLSSLNYSVYYSNGTVANNTAGIAVPSVSRVNVSNWTAGGSYYIKFDFIDSAGYSDNLTAYFRVARSTRIALSSSVSAISAGNSFTFTVTSTYDNSDGAPWSLSQPAGILCAPTTGNTSGTSPSCNVSSTISTSSYSSTLSQSISSCNVTTRSNFSCTFLPALANSTSASVNVTSTTTTTTTTTTTNQTTTTTTTTSYLVGSLNLTQFPTAVSAAANASTALTIKIKNTNTSEANVTTDVQESGEYTHFTLTYTNISSIAASAETDFTITVNAFQYVRPGEYTVQVFINNEPFNLTVSIPTPTDDKTVRRYVDVKKDKTQSTVALEVTNSKNYTVRMNITETIPKEVASNVSEVSFVTNYSQIIQEDPIVLFEVDLASAEKKEIQYSVNKDLSATDFSDPEVQESKKSIVTAAGGDLFSDPVFLTLILAAMIGASLAVIYSYVLKKPKMPSVTISKPQAPTAGPATSAPKQSVFSKLSNLSKIKDVFKRGPPGPPPTPWRED